MSYFKMLCIAVIGALAAVDLVSGGVLGGGGAAGYGRGPTGGGGGFGGGGGLGGGGFGGGGGGGGFGGAANGPPQPYSFQYAIRDALSGSDFSQHESGNGAGNVNGEYQVQLPDGRNQVVTYTASDATGYVANVQYSGQPHFGGGGGGGGGAGGFRGGAGGFGIGAGEGGFGGLGGGGGALAGTYLPPVRK